MKHWFIPAALAATLIGGILTARADDGKTVIGGTATRAGLACATEKDARAWIGVLMPGMGIEEALAAAKGAHLECSVFSDVVTLKGFTSTVKWNAGGSVVLTHFTSSSGTDLWSWTPSEDLPNA